MWSRHKSCVSKVITLLKSLIILCLLWIIVQSYRSLVRDKIDVSFTNQSRILLHSSKFMSHYDLIIDEGKTDISSVYYRHATSARNSSYPLISGDTFRAFADYVFDETRQDNLDSVKYGDSVFVKADMFPQFFSRPYESIKHPFVLITHNSDYHAPSNFRAKLDEKKILVWYASNPDIRQHPKLVPIPIGLANTRWPGGNLDKLMYAFKKHRKPWANRTILLYANFNLQTNPGQRQAALNQVSALRHVQIIKSPVPFEEYLKSVGNTKFVLSPPGNGLDCHRTWEALLLGAAPVMLSSGLDPLFKEIPAIVVDNWSKITENLLSSQNFSSYDHFTPQVLYARYWRESIVQHRNRTS